MNALELLRDVRPNHVLHGRIDEMAQQDPDLLVRGYARLLAADWGSISHATPSSPAQPARRMPPIDASPLSSYRPSANNFFNTTKVDRHVVPAGFEGRVVSHSRELDTGHGYPARSNFSPVTPFWLSAGSHNHSLPSDVERLYNVRGSTFTQVSDDQQPGILRRPIDAPQELEAATDDPWRDTLLSYEMDAPLGFTGPSGILPTEIQENSHFVPVEDRWRLGFPEWDRYDRGHPPGEDYPYTLGRLLDPYNQNVLKGDFPIIGQHTFLNITATSFMLHEYRQTPTATTPFESTANPFEEPFFGSPNQYFYAHYLRLGIDLFHGNAAFKPKDWQVRVEPVFNVNYLSVEELAVVNPDVRRGTTRTRTDFALEQWFVEAKLADLGSDYDFLSARAGSQFFVSDFRGFLFADVNRGVRLFGTRLANRDQFNLIWFDQTEKDTNSQLNTFNDRHQNTTILNYYRQDFVFPGYTSQFSFHYNKDEPSTRFDDNDFLVRPDASGVFREHQIDAFYLGWAGDGKIGRVNISHQLYIAMGNDSMNPIANEGQDIMAQMAAIELSYDRDWIRFRTSYFYASGDDDPNDTDAGGFDTILDDPIFAGGEFSYWQRQAIRLFGVNLVQQKSLVPNLRSSKIQGQSNFVNPGLHLINVGMDFEVTPKMKVITNANYLWFDNTAVLESFVFQDNIGRDIGTDLSVGIEYRPFLNDNVILVIGSAVLIPADGLRDLFGTEVPDAVAALVALHSNRLPRDETPEFQSHFLELVLTY